MVAFLLISHHILAKATRFCASGISSVRRAYAPPSLGPPALLPVLLLEAAIWRQAKRKNSDDATLR